MRLRLKTSLFDRRQFLRWLSGFGLTGVVGFLLYPVIRFLKPPEPPPPDQVVLKDLNTLPPNSARTFSYGRWASVIVRTDDGSLRAFNTRCTHLECTVGFDPANRRFECKCHGGVYDLAGRNIAGPPPKPLTRYEVSAERNGQVVVSLARPGQQAKSSS